VASKAWTAWIYKINPRSCVVSIDRFEVWAYL
jgi:hypothetical protein